MLYLLTILHCPPCLKPAESGSRDHGTRTCTLTDLGTAAYGAGALSEKARRVMRGVARRVGRGVGRVVVFCRREHDKIRERERV